MLTISAKQRRKCIMGNEVRIISFVLGFISYGVSQMPDFIHVCKSNDPELSKCIIASANHLRPKIAEGIPELDMPPLDPLILENLYLTNGFTVNITDLQVNGSSNFEIKELRASIPKNRFAIIARMPYLQFEGKYSMDTRILLFHLKGEGAIRGNFTDYHFTAVLKGNRIQKNGEEYLKFDKMKLDISFGKTQLQLDNLFSGSETLGQAANDVLNESNDAIMEEIRPALESSLADKFTDIANKITLRFTYKQLFS